MCRQPCGAACQTLPARYSWNSHLRSAPSRRLRNRSVCGKTRTARPLEYRLRADATSRVGRQILLGIMIRHLTLTAFQPVTQLGVCVRRTVSPFLGRQGKSSNCNTVEKEAHERKRHSEMV